jgi:hypothetical protein
VSEIFTGIPYPRDQRGIDALFLKEISSLARCVLTAFARRTGACPVVSNDNRKGTEEMKRLRNPLATLALGIGLALSPLAQATLVLGDGTVFDGIVSGSGNTYTLTLRMDFRNTVGGEYLGDTIEAWSLQLPGDATSTLTAAPGVVDDWTVYNTGKADADGCGNGAVTTICVDRGGKSQIHATGPVVTDDIFEWTLNIVFSEPQAFTAGGNFHLLTVDKDKNGQWKKGGDLISLELGRFLTCVPGTNGNGCNPPPPDEGSSVPEPGSLALIGLGTALAGLLRRRLRKQS